MASGSQPSTRLRSEYRPRRTPFRSFKARLESNSTHYSWKVLWSEEDRTIQPHHAALLDWSWENRRSRTVPVGARIKDLALTKLDIGNDSEWRMLHPLGHGGFGAVAAFEQRDWQTGALIDQIVAKTTLSRISEAVDRSRMDLPKEAAIMGQTNDCRTDGMARLRNFKYYSAPDSQWKFYFEYCPYGDLERMLVRYKAYGRYLPELFLWHLFYWLAKTVHTYANHQWNNTRVDRFGQPLPGGFLLHCDIKPQNILLGPPDDSVHDPVSLYPIPRLADLGLAAITADPDRHNTAAYFQKGTRMWMPPECRVSTMDPISRFYPFGDDPRVDVEVSLRKGYHTITSRANIWAIASVMFSAMTLKEPDLISDKVDAILTEITTIPYPELNENLIEDTDFEIIAPQYYSPRLRDLIKSCLHIRPTDRPSEDELLQDVKDGYEEFIRGIQFQALQNTDEGEDPPSIETIVDTDPDHKLYFIRNEIDTATDNYQFDHADRDPGWWTFRFVEDLPWVPPQWGKLWPVVMPINTQAPDHWNYALRTAFERSRQHIRYWDGIEEAARRGHPVGTGMNAPGVFVPGRGPDIVAVDNDDDDDGGDDDGNDGNNNWGDDVQTDIDAPTAEDDPDHPLHQQQQQHHHHQHHQHHNNHNQPTHQQQQQQQIQPPTTIIAIPLGTAGQAGSTRPSQQNNNNNDVALGRGSGAMSDVVQHTPPPGIQTPHNEAPLADDAGFMAWLNAQNAPTPAGPPAAQSPSGDRMSGVDQQQGVVRTNRPDLRYAPYPARRERRTQ